jgi:hypothetical protein
MLQRAGTGYMTLTMYLLKNLGRIRECGLQSALHPGLLRSYLTIKQNGWGTSSPYPHPRSQEGDNDVLY